MPYTIIDILRTHNYKGELVKTMYVCEIDLGDDLKANSEYTDGQIREFEDCQCKRSITKQ